MHVGRVLVLASALPVLIVGALTLSSIFQARQARAGLDRAYGVAQELDALVQRVSDLETVQRGYLLTGDTTLLQAYREAVGDATRGVTEVRSLALRSDGIAPRLDSLGAALSKRIAYAEETIATREREGLAGAARRIGATTTGSMTAEIRRLVTSIRRTEAVTVSEAAARLERSQRAVISVVIGGALLAAALAYLLTRRLARDAQHYERMRQMADRANRAKTEFLRLMSHELRTPLNAIAGHAQLLVMGLHGPIGPEQRAAIERIVNGQGRLLDAVNQILEFADLDTGRATLSREPVDLRLLVSAIVAELASERDARQLACVVDLPTDVYAYGSPSKIRIIVRNLVVNAIKFTPAGGHLGIDCTIDRTQARLLLRVSDSGVGIARETAATIFEPFVTGDASLGRLTEGLGLGLAVGRGLARAMGGDLYLADHTGPGTTLELALPLASSPVGSAATR